LSPVMERRILRRAGWRTASRWQAGGKRS